MCIAATLCRGSLALSSPWFNSMLGYTTLIIIGVFDVEHREKVGSHHDGRLCFARADLVENATIPRISDGPDGARQPIGANFRCSGTPMKLSSGFRFLAPSQSQRLPETECFSIAAQMKPAEIIEGACSVMET